MLTKRISCVGHHNTWVRWKALRILAVLRSTASRCGESRGERGYISLLWVGFLYLTKPPKASSKTWELVQWNAWLPQIWKQHFETVPWEGARRLAGTDYPEASLEIHASPCNWRRKVENYSTTDENLTISLFLNPHRTSLNVYITPDCFSKSTTSVFLIKTQNYRIWLDPDLHGLYFFHHYCLIFAAFT